MGKRRGVRKENRSHKAKMERKERRQRGTVRGVDKQTVKEMEKFNETSQRKSEGGQESRKNGR